MNRTVFVKVDVKDLPEREGNYIAIWEIVEGFPSAMTVSYSKEFSFHSDDSNIDCTSITHWLEEIELPSDDELKNRLYELLNENGYLKRPDDIQFYLGAKWFRDNILNKQDEDKN